MTISALSVDFHLNRTATKIHKEEISRDSMSSLDSAVDAHIEKQLKGQENHVISIIEKSLSFKN